MSRLSDSTLRRLAWAAFGFFVLSGLAALVVLLTDDSSFEDWGNSGTVGDVAFTLMVTLFPLTGVLITRRQPRNRIGWLLLAVGAAWAVSSLADLYVRWALILHPGSLPGGHGVQAFSSASWMPPMALMGIFLILLFPDGRLPSPRWRLVAWLGLFAMVGGTLGITVAPGVMDDVPVPGHQNPLGLESLRPVVFALMAISIPLLPLCVFASACSLVMRFRHSTGVARLQLKWLTTAGSFVAVAFLTTMVVSLPSMFQGEGGGEFSRWVSVLQTVSILSFALIPAAIGVAITRHGLYGIDAIINRALVFAVLAVFITGVYVAIVVGIGEAIGQGQRSVWLSVLATAVVAVAFQPVRQRVQGLANRLVYGELATPYEVLSDFATRMAGQYTTGELLPRMAQLVGQCLHGAQVEVWLVDGQRLVREVSWSRDGTTLVVTGPDEVPLGGEHLLPVDRWVPVRHQGDLLGIIAVTKPAGEPITPPEDALLANVASQAGLVLRNVRLLDDLRSSAERLVTSQDGERRRLERNLHDGAQQSLVSVALLLRMALARVDGDDPDGIAPSVVEASVQLQRAIEELRELARGIHPAILTDRGLGPAVIALAERSPIPVRVDFSLAQRLPAPVEGTLYFVVAEALTNVVKYAHASTAWVSVHRDGDVVSAVVCDDGVGGADAARGSGLVGLSDRVAAMDGSIDVHSPPGEGTRITCRVPVTAARAAVLEPVS
jgi:signal transduction histidine kinase